MRSAEERWRDRLDAVAQMAVFRVAVSRGDRPRARGRPGQRIRLGQGGRRRGLRPIGQPLPGRRGEPQAQEGERAAEEGERDTFESERLLRQQAAVGAGAKKARFAFILLNEGAWSISEMCAALHVTRQGCHAWRKRPPSAHDLRDAEPAAAISEICTASRGTYGAPKVFAELRRYGVRTSRKRAARIMREGGLSGTTRGCARRPKGGAKQAAPQPCAAPDLVRRDFAAGGPDEAWFAGITYVRTHQGWPCLAVVMDVWSRRVVGWSMSASMAAELADDALRMAIARRRPHVREPRAGGARDLRVHRVLLQQGQDALGAGVPQPRGVRAGQPARGGPPTDGGVGV